MHLDLLLKSSRSRLIFGSLKVDNLLYCSAFLVNFSSFFLKARDLGLGFFVWFGGFCLFWFRFICLFAWFVWFDFFCCFLLLFQQISHGLHLTISFTIIFDFTVILLISTVNKAYRKCYQRDYLMLTLGLFLAFSSEKKETDKLVL